MSDSGERCPKCSSNLVPRSEGQPLRPWVCPNPDHQALADLEEIKDCRIAELELAVACEKDDACKARGERDEARYQLEEAKKESNFHLRYAVCCEEGLELLEDDGDDNRPIAKVKKVIAERDEARSQLREAQSEVNRLKDELDKPCKGCGL